MNESEVEVIKAGVIQNFEFTYELCWKHIKRRLEKNIGSAYVDGITRRGLYRISAEHHLINDVEQWMIYHDARNETAHVYDLETANEIFEIAGKFFGDAQYCFAQIEKRND